MAVDLPRTLGVLVVGGGPIGAIAARSSASSGADTWVIEKKDRVSNSSSCGGLLSVAAFEGLEVSRNSILNEISGVVVYPPHEDRFVVESSVTRAYVVDRSALNQELMDAAMEEGAQLRTSVRAVQLESERIKLKHLADSTSAWFEPNIVLGSDGPYSDIRRELGLPDPGKYLHGIQAVSRCELNDQSLVEVHFGSDIATGFFGWVIPLGRDGLARIGLASVNRDGLLERLERLLDRKSAGEPQSLSSGPIPIGVPNVSASGNVGLVGDAAGQVKPTTGGGIYPGSKSARIAGEMAAAVCDNSSAFQNHDFAESYHNRWMEEVGADLKREMFLHRILAEISDPVLDTILRKLSNPRYIKILRESGDIDHLYRTALEIFKKPARWGNFIHLLPSKVRDSLTRAIFQKDK